MDASEVVVSPDGGNVYVASKYPQPGGVAIFDRGPDGALTQKAGTAGCISENGDGGSGARRRVPASARTARRFWAPSTSR